MRLSPTQRWEVRLLLEKGYQPLDADLTAIAALATTPYGRAFLTYADEAAFKAAVNLEAGTDFLTPAAIAALYRSSVSTDKGDANATLTAGTSERTSIWSTPLTVDRTVTLAGATNGDRFRVVRTAASTGTAVLNVGVGPLRVMGPAEWCDVEYTGAAWILTAAGALTDILLLG